MSVTLSAGVRENLLSLQQTASMLSTTQTRLATGKRVNSALDNPTNYFTSQNLSSRANDFSSLLDGISNATKTIQAADKGITAITKLVKSAQSTVRQALEDGQTNLGNTQIQGRLAIDTDGATEATTKARAEGRTLAQLGFADGDKISVTSTDSTGTESTVEVTVGGSDGDDLASTAKISELVAKVNASGVATASVTDDGRLDIASNKSETLTLSLTDDTAATTDYATDGDGTTAVDASNQTAAGSKSLFEALGFNGVADAAANATTGKGAIDVNFDADATGTTDGAVLTVASAKGTNSADRTALVEQFNSIRTQIDKLAADASFNGVNLINSSSSSLTVAFNEHRDSRKSELKIQGTDATSSGLGITAATTLSTAEANERLSQLTTSLTTLRSAGSSFGSNLSTVNIRKDFTKDMVNTLQTGADALVLADNNAEGARLLTLNTRQSLSTTALSLASRSDQAVLRLLARV